MTEQPTYNLVDVCWTLFSSNTTFDFLDFALHTPAYKRLRRLFSLTIFRKFNTLIYRLFHFDIFRTLAVRHLKGYSRQQLLTIAEQFYQDYLLQRQITQVWDNLPQQDLIILSGTLDIIAQTVATHLNAKTYYASTLQYRNNICTGKYNDRLLKKDTIAEQYQPFTIYTDNLTDLPLVIKAQQATIVCYNNQHKWLKQLNNKSNITFIHASTTRY